MTHFYQHVILQGNQRKRLKRTIRQEKDAFQNVQKPCLIFISSNILTQYYGCLQYMAIPMVEQPFPQAGLQASPRGSPSVPPSRRLSRRKTPPSQLNELPPPRDNEHRYGEIKGDRERQRNTAEENNSIVYAALNHQPVAGAAARPWRQKEESSEYVAIRIKANRHQKTIDKHFKSVHPGGAQEDN